MAKLDEFEELLRQETVFERIIGAEDAVKKTADALFSKADEKSVKREVEETIAKKGINARDAKAAFEVLKEHWVKKFKNDKPFIARIFSTIGSVGISWKVVEESGRAVVFRIENGKNCPVLKASGHDLKKARRFCEAHFKHQIPFDAESTLVIRAVNPRLKWKLKKMRENHEDFCEYALVLD